jgi:hypothetical protein
MAASNAALPNARSLCAATLFPAPKFSAPGRVFFIFFSLLTQSA